MTLTTNEMRLSVVQPWLVPASPCGRSVSAIFSADQSMGRLRLRHWPGLGRERSTYVTRGERANAVSHATRTEISRPTEVLPMARGLWSPLKCRFAPKSGDFRAARKDLERRENV